jgi:hypothetical protein
VKAIGGGLYATPDALPFVTDATRAPVLTDASGNDWTVVSVPAGEAYECRLVVPGRITKIAFYAMG